MTENEPGRRFFPETLFYDYRTEYAGLKLIEVEEDDGTETGPVAWSMFYDGDIGPTGCEHFLRLPQVERVGAMVVSGWGDLIEDTAEEVVRFLADNARRLPSVRSIFLGDIPQEVAEISWIRQTDITPLLEAYPLLERLDVRGGDGLVLRPVRHGNLKMLRFESGGLPAEVVRAVGVSEFPALEYLELWLGVPYYGGDATVADLEPILSGERLPALRRLGLRDSEIQDEIAAAVAGAPVVARLEALSLAMGTLTDEGAEALLSGQPLTHLRVLDLHHSFLSEAMIERIHAALPMVEVDLAASTDDGERYVAVSE
ncbi:STM4015 family protein [Planobispora siamensis]|uniref:Leucine-rich repeat domain-containing protein n=1 Tax=Planobispora siamensis TaxID=936338 RepID=A0A8J3WMN4_9ACTN|nr:STM4015 family protein [Planobispora siamensis]GIH93647.1 hypothetical protein Psi01_42770 [Planobispora siamensis]